ncbi:MAG: AbrB/MazE/SpoVT family DNA-binding domain-containing protein [Spirochaetes bacterium]|nr:AbrB/MazE/SpoVT family DNA-binding domain-containing protein [Spirochaetota bacterium]
MKVKVQKWGNSLAIRIPSSYAKDAGITDGTVADIKVSNASLVVKPIKNHYKLDDLLRGIKRTNLHSEIDSGASTGNESW